MARLKGFEIEIKRPNIQSYKYQVRSSRLSHSLVMKSIFHLSDTTAGGTTEEDEDCEEDYEEDYDEEDIIRCTQALSQHFDKYDDDEEEEDEEYKADDEEEVDMTQREYCQDLQENNQDISEYLEKNAKRTKIHNPYLRLPEPDLVDTDERVYLDVNGTYKIFKLGELFTKGPHKGGEPPKKIFTIKKLDSSNGEFKKALCLVSVLT